MNETSDTAPSLTAEVRVASGQLHLEYEVVNPGPAGIYLSVVPLTARHEVVPDSAYTQVDAGRRTLRFLLGASPKPAGSINVRSAINALAIHLSPGSSYQGQVLASLPIREWHAYAGPDDAEADAKPTTVDRVVLEIQYIPEEDTRFVEPWPEDELYDVGADEPRFLRFECELDEPLVVRERIDPFARRSR